MFLIGSAYYMKIRNSGVKEKSKAGYEMLSDGSIVAREIHVGVEMGGTSCKVGIFSAVTEPKLKLTSLYDKVFATSETDAMTTFNEIKDWIASSLMANYGQEAAIYP